MTFFLSRKTFFRSRLQPQTFIVSYPKCGRTWLRMLLGRYLCQTYALDSRLMLETLDLTRRAGLPPVTFTHDGSEMRKGVSWNPAILDKTPYRKRRVVLLIRDPRDVIVSCYFHATRRTMIYDGGLTDFIRSPQHGVGRYIDFLKAWERNSAVPQDFTILRYCDLHRNTETQLTTLLHFLGCEHISSVGVHEAVRYAGFSHMQHLEASGQLSSDRLTPGDSTDIESFKVRRGRVGGFRDYLTDEDCAFVDRTIRDAECSLLRPYCHPLSRNDPDNANATPTHTR